MTALDAEQILGFHTDGFIRLGKLFSGAEVRTMRDRLEAFEAAHPATWLGKTDMKANYLLRWVAENGADVRLVACMRGLIGPDIVHWNTSVRDKKPGDGRIAHWHQDSFAMNVHPVSLLTFVCLSESTRGNGCMQFVRGSHRWEYLDHIETGNPHSMLTRRQSIADYGVIADADVVHLEAAPGEVWIAHHHILHASDAATNGDRRLYLLHDHIPTWSRRRDLDHPRIVGTLVSGHNRMGFVDLMDPPAGDAPDFALQKRVVDRMAGSVYRDSTEAPRWYCGAGETWTGAPTPPSAASSECP